MTIRPGALLLNRRTGPEAGGAGQVVREAPAGGQGWRAEHDSIDSPPARPTLFTAAPNGLRISGAEGVRCMRGLGATCPGLPKCLELFSLLGMKLDGAVSKQLDTHSVPLRRIECATDTLDFGQEDMRCREAIWIVQGADEVRNRRLSEV